MLSFMIGIFVGIIIMCLCAVQKEGKRMKIIMDLSTGEIFAEENGERENLGAYLDRKLSESRLVLINVGQNGLESAELVCGERMREDD